MRFLEITAKSENGAHCMCARRPGITTLRRRDIRERKDARGQSLVEMIVACGILVTAVVGALSLATASIRAQRQTEQMVVAANFAREGIEAVRSIRDSNWMANVAFDTGLVRNAGGATDNGAAAVLAPATGAWSLDFAQDGFNNAFDMLYRYSVANGAIVPGLTVQSPSGVVANAATGYRRLVTVDPLCEGGSNYNVVTGGGGCGAAVKVGIRVTSTVQWQLAGATKSLSIEERMFDWH